MSRAGKAHWVCVLSCALFALATAAGSALGQPQVESDARTLEQRLRAPCCRGQMLDAHESEITRSLRLEIRDRLRGGESVSGIERDLVQRYGTSIVAIRTDADPRGKLSFSLAVLMALSGGLLVLFGLRWVRRTRALAAAEPARARADNDELDARLEQELRQLDT